MLTVHSFSQLCILFISTSSVDSTHSIKELDRKAFNPSCPAGQHFDLTHDALSFECISTHGACDKCILECKAYVVLVYFFFSCSSVYFVFEPAIVCHAASWLVIRKTHYRDSFVPLCGLERRANMIEVYWCFILLQGLSTGLFLLYQGCQLPYSYQSNTLHCMPNLEKKI